MPDCNYCEESFSDEESYLDHLHEAHDESELSRIDQRRVEQHLGDGGGPFPTGPVIIGILLLFTAGVLAYVTFFLGSGSSSAPVAKTPYGLDSVHEHGTINVTIDGQRLDFSQRQYQVQAESFHFEGGNGRVWHTHAQGVSLEYAMGTLGIDINQTAVTFDGETYRASDPNTEVIIEVNGEPVNPRTYVLQGAQSASEAQQGDHVRIVVRTGDSSSGGAAQTTTSG